MMQNVTENDYENRHAPYTENRTRSNSVEEIRTNWSLVYKPIIMPLNLVLGYYPAYWHPPECIKLTSIRDQIPSDDCCHLPSSSAVENPGYVQSDRFMEAPCSSTAISGEQNGANPAFDVTIDATHSKPRPKPKKSEKSVSNPSARRHECSQCGAKYNKRFQLNRHVKVTHIRPHVCDVCGKRFGHVNYLRQNIANVHNRQRNFECSQCGKHLSTNGNLILHIQTIHQGKREHKCSICQVRFAQLGNLSTHVRRHHKEYFEDQIQIGDV